VFPGVEWPSAFARIMRGHKKSPSRHFKIPQKIIKVLMKNERIFMTRNADVQTCMPA
jgi:hypothetical protein